MTNTLYFGDNLPILRNMPANSVEVVYLDPPFNSSRSYNVLFKDESGTSYDARINALVYELYGLTEEEIKLVEGD
jgi:site-specific DNA-methyltransferase (adenine-specific)